MTCELYYDFSSPYSYLAATQAQRICAGHELVWRPMLLGALFNAIGTPTVPIATFPEAKARHTILDLFRWAEHWGVELIWPRKFPQKTVTALRAALLSGPEDIARVSLAIFREMWAHDGDLEDDRTIARVLEAEGLDGASIVERTRAPEGKQRLFDATDAAIRAGVPGAPTFIVGDQLFWGQDRMHFVEKALKGWRPRLPAELIELRIRGSRSE